MNHISLNNKIITILNIFHFYNKRKIYVYINVYNIVAKKDRLMIIHSTI